MSQNLLINGTPKCSDWIANEKEDIELLLLAHTTTWGNFQTIFAEGKISKEKSYFPPNDTNAEQLVYLFYGIPFYKVKVGDSIYTKQVDTRPIGLLFKPEIITGANKCYPFDTGAFFKGYYKPLLTPLNANISDYEIRLSKNGVEIKKLVKRYYGGNTNYCYGIGDFKDVPSCKEEENLLKLSNNPEDAPYDERVSAIEIHHPNDLFITGNLEVAFLPECTYNRKKKAFAELEKLYEVRLYFDNDRYSPEVDCGKISQLAQEYYKNKGMLTFA